MRVPTSTTVTIIVDCDAFPLSADEIYSAIPTNDGYVNIPALAQVKTASVDVGYCFFVKAQETPGEGFFTLEAHYIQDARTINARGELLASALRSLPNLFKGAEGTFQRHPLQSAIKMASYTFQTNPSSRQTKHPRR